VQVRVVQGKEPPHFRAIFKGPLIISNGGFSRSEKANVGLSETALYQVRATSQGGAKAIEVKASASSLNSNDAFVLKTPDACYIWSGKGASDDETSASKYVTGKITSLTPTDVKEGDEPEDFWSILGGKQPYASSPRLMEDLENTNPPRLFTISNAKGYVDIEEVPGEFCQSDLEPDDVMILDTFTEVFLWIGQGANDIEKKEAPKLVNDYISNDPRARDSSAPIITVKMNNEPITFTGYFPSWDENLFKNTQSIEERLKAIS
jgi:hypothetical protein